MFDGSAPCIPTVRCFAAKCSDGPWNVSTVPPSWQKRVQIAALDPSYPRWSVLIENTGARAPFCSSERYSERCSTLPIRFQRRVARDLRERRAANRFQDHRVRTRGWISLNGP